MGTINYLFEPSEMVYVIDEHDDHAYVKLGKVIRIRAEVLVTETVVKYDIRLDGQAGTKEFDESDVFSSVGSPPLAEVMAEYEKRI